MAGIIQFVDAKIADLFSGWNVYSSALLVSIVAFTAWTLYNTQDADTHPLLLARQAHPSYVRNAGESAVYRSPEAPHGYPLRTGLGVKAPGAPMYTSGRDGDLRDIWRRVCGELSLDNNTAADQIGKVMTVFGRKDTTDHNIADLSREISIVGKHLQDHGAKRVAVYLPNSVEVLAAVFGGAYYGFSPILVPYNQPPKTLITLLQQCKADSLIAEAGSLPLAELGGQLPLLRQVIWTVEKTSRHMDWSDVPEGIGGKIDVSVWHEIVQDQKNGVELPKDTDSSTSANLIFLWQASLSGTAEVVEFSQQNVVAAVSALISALPAHQRMSPSDVLLPADLFSNSYCLCLTLAALYSRTTVVINSVAGPGVDLSLASRSIAPTMTVVSAETAAKLHSESTTSITGAFTKLAHALETRVLTTGRMPTDTWLTRLNAPTRASIGTTPGELRLLFVSERTGLDTPPLTSKDLSDLRIYTKARVIYALTAAKVAGAVAQTNMYDYRRGIGPEHKHNHFGAPLGCLEVKLIDSPPHKISDDNIVGEMVVSGPSVAGGETRLGVTGTFREDHTLAYV